MVCLFVRLPFMSMNRGNKALAYCLRLQAKTACCLQKGKRTSTMGRKKASDGGPGPLRSTRIRCSKGEGAKEGETSFRQGQERTMQEGERSEAQGCVVNAPFYTHQPPGPNELCLLTCRRLSPRSPVHTLRTSSEIPKLSFISNRSSISTRDWPQKLLSGREGGLEPWYWYMSILGGPLWKGRR